MHPAFVHARSLAHIAFGILAFGNATTSALALTPDQALANCRATVGTPTIQACAAGDRSKIDACRAKGAPRVKACVMAALNAANGRPNVPLALNKPKTQAVAPGNALPSGFVAPPRTIADITAILDKEKPDPKTLAAIQERANAEPRLGMSRGDLAEFLYDRAQARALLGRVNEALADTQKAAAAAIAAGDSHFAQRMQVFVGQQKIALGDIKGALQTGLALIRDAQRSNNLGYLFSANRSVAGVLVQMGDIPQAEVYSRKSQAQLVEMRTSGLPVKQANYRLKGRNWEGEAESTRATIFEARGQFRQAEQAYAKARDWRIASIPDMAKQEHVATEAELRANADADLLSVARMKAKQGRRAEAEVDARNALLARLKTGGKYNPGTTKYVIGLADVMVDEGRYSEAEQLTRTALDIQRTLKIGDDTQTSAQMLSQLGAILTLQRKIADASAVYTQLDSAIAKWEPGRRQAFELNGSRIDALFASGQIEQGLAAAQALMNKELARVGDKHFDSASARGTLAIGYMKAGKDADAIRELQTAIPLLLASSRENADDEEATVKVARDDRLQTIVESYIALLAKNPAIAPNASTETFALADSIRGRSVQTALAESSARASVRDPALAELVRKEQDLSKQVNAQLGVYNNLLSLPSDQRDEKGVKDIAASIDALRAHRDKARVEINVQFPAYVDLVSPKPPSVDQIKATLVAGEAMLSFYFGRESSFVWAVPKEGPIAFSAIAATGGDVESRVRKLREALEPQAAMISDIPPFDLKLGYELYSLLLKPVEAGWKSSKSLIVVTNGALGLLPLSLLPTAPAELAANEDVLFSSYRNVPWLARTHAVTMVPSSAALRTLRQLPPGKPRRGELIAFGDPYFSKEQHEEVLKAEAQGQTKIKLADAGAATTRGLPLSRRSSPQLEGVDSAELAMLPRLPDTADELKSIALALQADPSKVLNLGKDANEKNVKTMDLSGFKVLAFATHGLVPGELNGLTQPALALSAPAVAGVEGDGLLTQYRRTV